MKKYYLLFLLLFIVGCVNDSGGDNVINSNSYGIIVTNFTSTLNSLRVYESTDVKLSFTNNGDFSARNINSILYGEGLLERVHQVNYTDSLRPDGKFFHLWTLKAPVKLSQSSVTVYTISDRVYYDYNFSTTQQIGFVPLSYSGGDLSLSSVVKRSPISAHIKFSNPIRTIPVSEGSDESVFALTIIISNIGDGSVGYYGCSLTSGCSKNGYLNSFYITVPSDWVLIGDYEYSKINGDGVVTYVFDYDSLNNDYNNNDCNCNPSDDDCNPSSLCTKISNSLHALRLVRDSESRFVLQFRRGIVDSEVVNQIVVGGDFGYIVDVRDFTNPITITINGD